MFSTPNQCDFTTPFRSNNTKRKPPAYVDICHFRQLIQSVSCAVELLIYQVKEKVYVELQSLLEQAHILVVIELRAQAFLQWHLCARSGNLYASQAALNEEDTDLVTGNGDIDLIPLLLRVTLP
jgi:hypothetical protein